MIKFNCWCVDLLLIDIKCLEKTAPDLQSRNMRALHALRQSLNGWLVFSRWLDISRSEYYMHTAATFFLSPILVISDDYPNYGGVKCWHRHSDKYTSRWYFSDDSFGRLVRHNSYVHCDSPSQRANHLMSRQSIHSQRRCHSPMVCEVALIASAPSAMRRRVALTIAPSQMR